MIPQGQFSIRPHGRISLIEVAGDLDISNVQEFEDTFERAVAKEPDTVVISLEGASYFDSKGIQALFRFAERLGSSQRRLLLVAPLGSSPRRILDIAGIPSAIPTFASFDEAVSAGTPA